MSAVSAWRILLAGLCACATLLPLACAGSSGLQSSGLPADCVFLRTIRDYDALDADDIVVYGPGDTAYHIVLNTPSIGIEGEYAIGIYDDGDGRICPYGRDSIIIDGALTEEIRIRSIESVDEAELEALMVEFGVIEGAGAAVTPERIL